MDALHCVRAAFAIHQHQLVPPVVRAGLLVDDHNVSCMFLAAMSWREDGDHHFVGKYY
jgi:hypothetical protein